MDSPEDAANPKRGTALLIITIIVIASTAVIIILPGAIDRPNLVVKVAIVDSGFDAEDSLTSRVIAQRSFINQSYGYAYTDNTTQDSTPNGYLHGTHVAEIVAKEAPNVALVNAKVVTSENVATEEGIIAAIQWAVLVQECDVINLSLGGSASNHDPLRDAIRWAFNRGVVIVAAVGNNGQNGISGSSIESPACYQEVIGVAAVDETGLAYGFSGRGPLRNRTLKPDISAAGFYVVNGGTVFGTSFAVPIVSAGAANLVEYCMARGWQWTPGLVKASILVSAKPLSSEAWEVGAGLLDITSAKRVIDDAPMRDNLPLVAWVLPDPGPFEFERWFVNTTASIEISVFASGNATFQIFLQGTGAPWTRGPEDIQVNQTGRFTVIITVLSPTEIENLMTQITLVSPDYIYVRAQIKFDVDRYFAKVALDVSHSPWWIDSVYGQFRILYEKLTSLGIAIEEISDPSAITPEHLQSFDAVLILDPCAWDKVRIGEQPVIMGAMKYTTSEIAAYTTYWEDGGSIMVAGLSNHSINIGYANKLLSDFNTSFNYDSIPPIIIDIGGVASTTLVTELADHRIMHDVSSFDYVGCTLNYSGNGFSLAHVTLEIEDIWGFKHEINKTVMVGLESKMGSRLVVTGSNFFLDNWGLSGLYQSEDNSLLLLQIVYWLVGWF